MSKKFYIKNIIVFIVLCFSLMLGCKKLKEKKQTEKIRYELKQILEKYDVEKLNNPTPWDSYAEIRFREALSFLEGREILEKPYVLYAYLGFLLDSIKLDSNVSLNISWLDLSYNTKGLRILCERNGVKETLNLPVMSLNYDKYYTKASSIRRFPYLCEIGTRWFCDHISQMVTVPEYIFSENVHIYVTIYNDDGKQSDPLELYIQKELKDYINPKDSNSILFKFSKVDMRDEIKHWPVVIQEPNSIELIGQIRQKKDEIRGRPEYILYFDPNDELYWIKVIDHSLVNSIEEWRGPIGVE